MRRGIVLGALVAIVALSLAGVGAQGQQGGPKEIMILVDCCGGHGNLFVLNGGPGVDVLNGGPGDDVLIQD